METIFHPYRGNHPRSPSELARWHATAHRVEALEPSLPIVDPHHHLPGAKGRIDYCLDDLRSDVGSGHRIIATVYVEGYEAGWRKTGADSMRSVGEVAMVVDVAAAPVQTPYGDCRIGAGIVSHVDLTQRDVIAEVLDAHIAASQGRLRGVRHSAATDDGSVGASMKGQPPPHLLLDEALRGGFTHLEGRKLVFDAWIYHTQLRELIDLADAFPNTIIVLDHIGAPLGVAEWSGKRDEVQANWQSDLGTLALRPNVRVKIGGMGMVIFGFGFERAERPPTSDELARAWQPYIHTCLDAFGTGRCMLESNFPVDRQSCSYVELWNAFKLATQTLSVDERSDLFYRTACQTYRLPDVAQLGDSIARTG
jgi:predicted TIM-barrel fold metal-dependent hydrolase